MFTLSTAIIKWLPNFIIVPILVLLSMPAIGQVFEPTYFNADSAHYAVPFRMDAVFINTHDKPLRYQRSYSCPNPSDGTIGWEVKGKSIAFSDTTIAPGDSIELFCVLISFSYNVSLGCGMWFRAPDGSSVQPPVGIGGTITKARQMQPLRDTIDLGEVEIGDTKVDSVILVNVGNGIAHLVFWTNSHDMRMNDEGLVIVEPGDTVSVAFTYEPTSLGSHSGEIVYGSPYSSSLPAYHGAGLAFGSGVPRSVGLTPLTETVRLFAYSSDNPDVDTSRYFAAQATEVVSVHLVSGMHFTLDPLSLPITLPAGSKFNVAVQLHTDSVGLFLDTLMITTSDNSTTRVPVVGRVLVTDVEEDADPHCVVHPNPSSSEIEWCGIPNERWQIVNNLGEVVAMLRSDEGGRCAWSGEQSGNYYLVSERTRTSTQFVLLK